MINNTNSFQEIMKEFKTLSNLMKWAVRTYASNKLVEEGATEVGTSDINCMIVQLHKELGSFSSIVIHALNGTVDEDKWVLRL